MNIEELKYHIVNKEILPNVLIFKYRKGSNNSKFLFHQYINEYSSDNNMNIIVQDDITSIMTTSLFNVEDTSNTIYMYETPKIDQLINSRHNIWVLCNTISKRVKDEYNDSIIELSTIEDWQIKDYIDFNLPSLESSEKDRLYNNYKSDLFRLELEIDKLNLSNKDINTWYNIIKDQLYVDSTEYSIFDITNCILRRDKKRLQQLKNDINYIDIDAFGFIKILLTNFKYVIDIQLAKNSTPDYVGVPNKQFWAIKNYSCNHYSKEELVYIYKFLLSLDMGIKSGRIPIEIVVDYIISKIMLLGDLE